MLASGLVERRIDPAGLSSYLWNGFVCGPGTIIRGVQLLPEGTTMSIDPGPVCSKPKRYWQLPAAPAQRTSDMEQARQTLHESVRMRLVADVPLGIFLSGGIDSSAIATMAVEAAPGSVKTFNVGFEQEGLNESPYAEAVAEALGTDHTTVRLTEPMFQEQLDDALGSIDQPTFDAINTYFVSRAVRDAGITVALAGTGGDEVFGGYRSFADLPRVHRLARWLWPVAKPALHAALGLVNACRGGSGELPPQTRWGKLGDALGTRGDLQLLYQVAYALFTRRFAAALDGHAANGTDVDYGLSGEARDALAETVDGNPMLHAISLLELKQFIGQRLMRDTDAASMAVSLEVRVPLLDHDLIETVAGLDDATRFMPIRGKQALRRLALGKLDPSLFDRPKSGFVLPIEHWLKRGLAQRVGEALNDRDACQRVGLDADQAQRLWRAHQQEAPGMYWSRPWALFVLINWASRQKVTL